MDITIPSIFDKTLAPEGYYIMNCFMQYTPYHPNDGSEATPISHDLIKQTFFNEINQYLDEPLENSVHFMDILTPFDLENILNLTEGNIFHGSIGI
jgi:phytoene dehydrogenase-like protein